MVLPTGRSTSLNPGSPLPQPRKTALTTLTSNSVSWLYISITTTSWPSALRVVFDGTSLVLSYTAGNTSSQTFRPERYPTARYVTAEAPETLDADPLTGPAAPPETECSAEDPEPEETAASPATECSAEAPEPEETAAPPAEESDARVLAAKETATLPVEES